VRQLLMVVAPADGPLNMLPTSSQLTWVSVISVIRRRVIGWPIFVLPVQI
jgi:hypothetical protein